MLKRLLLTFPLITVLLASCASQTVNQPANQPQAAPPAAQASVTPFLPAQPTADPGQVSVPASTATPLPIATSRGPNLEATDPRTVSLASGNLQFVEFFRFT